jgi:tryptophan halogenase
MSENSIRSIAIVGGGAAGWLTAAVLARVLRGKIAVTVVEQNDDHGLIEPETATLPQLRGLHGIIGIDENDLLRSTGGTFRLGSEFVDFGQIGSSYFHPFGETGASLNSVAFRHHWLKLNRAGEPSELSEFSLCAVAARAGKFARPTSDARSVLSTLEYGYHLDAVLYADYLRDVALKLGAARRNGAVSANRDADGTVTTLALEDGSRIEADFFIDCSGALTPGDHGFEDWSRWLPCDRSVTIATPPAQDIPSFTQCKALPWGWKWQLPLQHCTGNGIAYSSRYVRDDEALAVLRASLPSTSGEPRRVTFTSGRAKKFWHGNVVAIGRAACAFDPIEFTALYIVQVGITRLLALFPDRSVSQIERDEYNRLMTNETERIRDFLILHYKATQRDDSPSWTHCRDMEVPEPLAYKLRQFRNRGRVVLYDEETFAENSWASVFLGQGIIPDRYDPLANGLEIEQVKAQLSRMRSTIRRGADSMPPHRLFVDKFCRATVPEQT